LIAIGPLVVMSLILAFPPELRGVATLSLIFGWGVAAGYKDWIIAMRQEENKMKLMASEKYYEENLR